MAAPTRIVSVRASYVVRVLQHSGYSHGSVLYQPSVNSLHQSWRGKQPLILLGCNVPHVAWQVAYMILYIWSLCWENG